MDPEEIAKLAEELKLETNVDETVVRIQDNMAPTSGEGSDNNFKKLVVGKIFTHRITNRETLRTHVPRILQTRGEVDIEIVGDNILAVVFANGCDRLHSLYDGPWHFFDSLMLFQVPKGMEKLTDVQVNDFTTWIQCHNLPLACMNPTSVRRIGEVVGTVEEIDTGEGGNCLGQYAQIRVTRKIEQPLQRRVRIMEGSKNEVHMTIIRYERLPEFCSACGRVRHVVRHCQDMTVDKSKKPFGTWLRAIRTIELRQTRRMSPTREGNHPTRSRDVLISTDGSPKPDYQVGQVIPPSVSGGIFVERNHKLSS